MTLNNVSAAVLAGGASRRMGEDKASLKLGGRSFLEIQAEKLKSLGIEDIIVSCAKGRIPPLPEGTRPAEDSAPGLGPLEGIRASLEAARNSFCLVVSVDAVAVDADVFALLADTALQKNAPVVLLESGYGPEPLIGVYSKAVLGEAGRLLKEGKRAVRGLFAAFPPLTVPLPEGHPALLNCNTPEDLRNVAALLSEQR